MARLASSRHLTPALLALTAACSAAEPLCQSDEAVEDGAGLHLCDGLTVHRPRAETCDAPGACESDDECDDDELCLCSSGEARCVDAGCRTDAECGGLLCAQSRDACGVRGFFCETPRDLCTAGESGCVFWPDRGRWDSGGAVGCP